MTVLADNSTTGVTVSCRTLLDLDTTKRSILHYMAKRYFPIKDGNYSFILHFSVVACTLIPIVISAFFSSPIPLIHQTAEHPLPIFWDLNMWFMFLVSLPYLLWLTSSDQFVLVDSLLSVQKEGVFVISEVFQNKLIDRWNNYFKKWINPLGQTAGALLGLSVVYFNLYVYMGPSVGFWIADNGHLVPVGYIFLCGVCLFYAIATVCVVRVFAISYFLYEFAAHAKLYMLPFHPDRAGGLLSVGRLGLRNQYALTVLGINIVLLVIISHFFLSFSVSLLWLIAAAIVALVVCGPMVFFGPLLPFRRSMAESKRELMSELGYRIRLDVARLRQQFVSGPITKEDEEIIERLRKLSEVISELPVWPFDVYTRRKYLTAYITPLLGSGGYVLLRLLLALGGNHFLPMVPIH